MAKLKIQHTRTGAAGYEAGATIVNDSYNSPTTISSNHMGGVGGFTSQTIPTIQPSVKVRGATATVGSILAQKGRKKFEVSDQNTVQDESIIAGQQYRILSVGTTNWQALGAGPNATTNDVFTAKVSGAGLTTTGTVQNVATCTLVDKQASELNSANTMTILATVATITGANVANVGSRTSAQVTWVAGNVSGYANPVVGHQITGTALTGNLTITAVNSSTNVTVSCDDQTVSNAQANISQTFNVSRISSKYVWDWQATPGKWRYWFGNPQNGSGQLSSQPAWQANTFVKVTSA